MAISFVFVWAGSPEGLRERLRSVRMGRSVKVTMCITMFTVRAAGEGASTREFPVCA